MFDEGVPLRVGQGKGSGSVGFGDGGLRSEIGEFGVGGSRVGGTLGTEVDGSGGLGVGGSGVGGNVGTFGGQLCVPEIGDRTSILTAMTLQSVPTLIDNASTPVPRFIDHCKTNIQMIYW